ncbi:tRNA uridine 5-carboxymethylaminomethyl modification enzyme [Frankliniella fusca]|uniref:tRNA uridine 5-carboxymethylaminomethyl modification enzyme n=1 Tax=Frankliniella fusca TaxID=407009 RepID=A0AAE1GYV2_9NEOP|nr:tRNA uridine 5-carboxymethylaminomethyl modification enzyme [Frankliniella fusca]
MTRYRYGPQIIQSKQPKEIAFLGQCRFDRISCSAFGTALNKGGSSSCSAVDYKGVPCGDGTFVEDGKIHFGNNLILKSSDITAIEMSSFDLRKRVKGLLELLYPNDILQRALKPDKVKDTNVTLMIPQGIVCVITEVLKRMTWESDSMKGFTSKQCAIVITKVLTQLRSDAAFSRLTPAEQERKRDERKRKAKESREKNKNSKKSKDNNTDNSSEEEEQS